MAGVRVGEVTGISLDRITFKANVLMAIDDEQDHIPNDKNTHGYFCPFTHAHYHPPNIIVVNTKSKLKMAKEEYTTVRVVARDIPSEVGMVKYP